MKKNGWHKHKYLVLGRKYTPESNNMFSEPDTTFCFDIIHWHTAGDWKWRQVEKTLQKRRFQFSPCTIWLQISCQQTIVTPLGTSRAPLLADLFLYSYESDFIYGLLKKNDKKLTWSFNFTFRYKDDDSEGRLINLYVATFQQQVHMEYTLYISWFIQYSRACGSYKDFLDSRLLPTRKILNQGILLVELKSSLRKFYGRHHDLIYRYGILVSPMTQICSTCCKQCPVSISSFMTYHRGCNYRGGSRRSTRRPPLPKIGKNMIFFS